MATQFKKDVVAQLAEKISKAQSIVLVDYQGLTVNDETALRRTLKVAGGEYLVTKNRLFKIALKEAGVTDSFDELLEGTTSFAFGYTDPVSPAKAMFDLSKAKKKQNIFKIKGGVLTGKRVETAGIEALANLPSRDQLLSMVLNSMLGPIRKLAYAAVAISDKKNVG
ncbi:MAG: 50S ribosomal protein L10 [Fusobacteriaceae bacterium]